MGRLSKWKDSAVQGLNLFLASVQQQNVIIPVSRGSAAVLLFYHPYPTVLSF